MRLLNGINTAAKTIKLPDLAPGKYTLLVKYYNPVNGYASPESSLTLRIKPKWYASVTAKTFYILLSVSLLWLASVYIRTHRRKKRQEQMKKLETKRKEELLDSTVQLFENIAQELTMPVTMISGPCQQILEYEKSDSFIRQHGEKILQHSGKLLGMLRMFQNFSESSDSEQGYVQMFSPAGPAEPVRIEPGDSLVAAVRIADDHGQSFWYLLGSWLNKGSMYREHPDSLNGQYDSWQPGEELQLWSH